MITENSVNTTMYWLRSIKLDVSVRRWSVEKTSESSSFTVHNKHTDVFTVFFVIINTMPQSHSWEANSSSASRETHSILWNPKVHYRIHNSPLHVPVLSHINSVHASLYILKMYFNIILPSTPRSSKLFLSLRFPLDNPVCTTPLPHTCHTPRPSHSSRFVRPNNIWWEVQIMNLIPMQSPPDPC